MIFKAKLKLESGNKQKLIWPPGGYLESEAENLQASILTTNNTESEIQKKSEVMLWRPYVCRRTDGQTDGRTDGQGESNIPTHTKLRWSRVYIPVGVKLGKTIVQYSLILAPVIINNTQVI